MEELGGTLSKGEHISALWGGGGAAHTGRKKTWK